jgi:hypothetical protein
MKRWIATTIVVYFIILASTVQAGGLLQKHYFLGLWQGIDAVDGSEAQRSITLNRDGTFNIIGYETYFSGCNGGRGLVTATGVLENGVIISEDFRLTCFDKFVTEPFEARYIPDKLNGSLKEELNDSSFNPTILQKISNR